MRYMGSKARHAKHISPILMDGHDQSKWYVEPFMGGGNMLSNVPAKHKWGNDTAEYAVALLSAVASGWEPPETLTEDEYYSIKSDPDQYEAALVGFAAYCCSYGGKLWGGYARNKPEEGKNSTCPGQKKRNLIKQRNFAGEQVRNLQNQFLGLVGVKFTSISFLDLDIPDGSTVYCDPPYVSTTGYGSGFDHQVFWDWATDISRRCRVFVSEYMAPKEWESIWEKRVNNSLTSDTGCKKATESLFILNDGQADYPRSLF